MGRSDGESMDDRTKRRLRRKYKANGIYNPALFGSSSPKKSTECNAQVENPIYDKDYEKYLSLMQKNKGKWDRDHDVIRSADDGCCENEHRNGHCSGEGIDVTSVDDGGNQHSVDNDTRVVEDSGSGCSVDDNANLKSVLDSDGDGGNGNANNHGKSLNGGVVDDDMDPQYKMFWDNLKEDGDSFVLEIVQEDGRVNRIRYHQGDGSPDEIDLDTMDSQGKEKNEFKNRETMEISEDAPVKNSSVKKRNVKLEALEHDLDGTNVGSSKRPCLEVLNTPESVGTSLLKENPETRRNSVTVIEKRNLEDCPEKRNGLEKKSSMLKKNLKEADPNPLSARPNGCSHKQSGCGYNSEAESDSSLTNESYQEFLNCTRDEGKGMVFKSKSGRLLIYDSDEEYSSDSDVIVLDKDPHVEHHKMDVDRHRSTESPSQFRQHIMQELKNPYSIEEYLDLLEKWSRQRPAKGHDKNLRNGSVKSYSLPGEYGKSYQELFKDLAVKIDAVADDRPRKLNFLRGFFYWLEHLSLEGSFRPWNDKACLKVLPEKQ